MAQGACIIDISLKGPKEKNGPYDWKTTFVMMVPHTFLIIPFLTQLWTVTRRQVVNITSQSTDESSA